jgi:CDP-diacylglycerol--serine O-phosphatidyltransferase
VGVATIRTTQVGTISSDHFVGLPIPAGAGMNAASVLLCNRFGIEGDANSIWILVMLYVLSFLMVSTIKYESFKKAELFTKMNFNVLVAIVLMLIFIAAQPSIALFVLGITYVISGPITTLRHHKWTKREKAETREIDKQTSSP